MITKIVLNFNSNIFSSKITKCLYQNFNHFLIKSKFYHLKNFLKINHQQKWKSSFSSICSLEKSNKFSKRKSILIFVIVLKYFAHWAWRWILLSFFSSCFWRFITILRSHLICCFKHKMITHFFFINNSIRVSIKLFKHFLNLYWIWRYRWSNRNKANDKAYRQKEVRFIEGHV